LHQEIIMQFVFSQTTIEDRSNPRTFQNQFHLDTTLLEILVDFIFCSIAHMRANLAAAFHFS
jgi:hypothetical protein